MADRRLWFRHQCIVCKMLFVSERDLVLHEATHDKPNFACSSCREVFEDADEYKFHTSVGCESNSSAQVCGDCGAVFEQSRDLYEHHSAVHLSDQKFQCKFCSANFSWPENLEKHELMHQTNSSMCKTCGAIFASMASLKVHLWKAHSVNIQEQGSHMVEMNVSCRSHCRECKSIGTSTELCVGCLTSNPEDVASRSNDEKPYKCSLCNWAFKYDFSYTLHMKMHEEKMQKEENHAGMNVRFTDLNENSSLQSSKCDTSVQTTANTKKTVYIRRTDNTYNFSAFSKIPVIFAKTGKPPVIKISAENTDGRKDQAAVTNNVTKEHLPINVPTRKSQLHQSPSNGAFTCKTCMVTFKYDFSYVAHMNYHKKMQQLSSENDEVHFEEYCSGNVHRTLVPKSQLSACEILMNSDSAILNSDGSILIRVDDVIQQNLMDSALKMYSFTDDKMPVVFPTTDLDKSEMKYVLIQSEQDTLEPESIAEPDTSCVVEEVINADGRNSSVLEVSYLSEESQSCLGNKIAKDSSDMEQAIIVDNKDDEFLLNSDLQLTSGHLELDRIADVPTDSGESNTEIKTEPIKGSCYSVLVDKPIPPAKNGLCSNAKEKIHRCSFCHAEFRSKTSLSTHMRKHVKQPKRLVSSLQLLKVRKAIIRAYDSD